MTTSTRITTLGSLPSAVTWGVMIIPVISHRAIGHSNIRFSSLLAMHLGSSILSTRSSWVPVCVLLGKVPHIVTRFTTAVKVDGDCDLLGISTLTDPPATTTSAPNWWRWSNLGICIHGSSHISGDSLTYHGLKLHRLSWECSLISSGKSRFSGRCSRPRASGSFISINKLLVLGFSRPNYFLKVQTVRLRDQVQVHVMCLEEKFRCIHILIQGPELKCRAGAPSQRTIQAREMMRLEETSIGQLS